MFFSTKAASLVTLGLLGLTNAGDDKINCYELGGKKCRNTDACHWMEGTCYPVWPDYGDAEDYDEDEYEYIYCMDFETADECKNTDGCSWDAEWESCMMDYDEEEYEYGDDDYVYCMDLEDADECKNTDGCFWDAKWEFCEIGDELDMATPAPTDQDDDFLPNIPPTLSPVTSPTDKPVSASPSHCNYPMWNMPEVGTDTRCDHTSGCPKRTLDCENLFAKFVGEECTLTCANDRDGPTETVKCVGPDEWETVGPSLDCADETTDEINCYELGGKKCRNTAGCSWMEGTCYPGEHDDHCYNLGRVKCRNTFGCAFDGTYCIQYDEEEEIIDECSALGGKKCRERRECAWNKATSECRYDFILDFFGGGDSSEEEGPCADLGNRKCKRTEGCAWKAKKSLCVADCEAYTGRLACKEALCRWNNSDKVCLQPRN